MIPFQILSCTPLAVHRPTLQSRGATAAHARVSELALCINSTACEAAGSSAQVSLNICSGSPEICSTHAESGVSADPRLMDVVTRCFDARQARLLVVITPLDCSMNIFLVGIFFPITVGRIQPVIPKSIPRDTCQETSVFAVRELGARSPQGYRKVFVEKVYELRNICSISQLSAPSVAAESLWFGLARTHALSFSSLP